MRLYSFIVNGRPRIGAEWKHQLIDLSAAHAAEAAKNPERAKDLRVLPPDMMAFVRLGEIGSNAAGNALSFMAKRPALPVGERASYLFEEVELLPPIVRPGKILLRETGSS